MNSTVLRYKQNGVFIYCKFIVLSSLIKKTVTIKELYEYH